MRGGGKRRGGGTRAERGSEIVEKAKDLRREHQAEDTLIQSVFAKILPLSRFCFNFCLLLAPLCSTELIPWQSAVPLKRYCAMSGGKKKKKEEKKYLTIHARQRRINLNKSDICTGDENLCSLAVTTLQWSGRKKNTSKWQ